MIPFFRPHFTGEEVRLVTSAIESSWISDGAFVKEFERDLEVKLHPNKTLVTSSGTASLQLALMALGIGHGDEVIVPSYTFAGPVNMIRLMGAVPVFVKVEPNSWLIDPTVIESAITKKTKAIVPVHLYGNVCDMRAINEIARKHHLFVIEDTAEAFLSERENILAGTSGTIGCFSFQATKIITTGEGGAVCTSNQDLFARMILIRSHGMDAQKKYWHSEIGHNFRLTNLQAAMGVAQLPGIEQNIRLRNSRRARYEELLKAIPWIEWQSFSESVRPVFWGLPLMTRLGAGKRDLLMQHLRERGIDTRPGFTSFDQMPIYHAPLEPIAREISDNLILIPFFPDLSDADIDTVVKAMTDFI